MKNPLQVLARLQELRRQTRDKKQRERLNAIRRKALAERKENREIKREQDRKTHQARIKPKKKRQRKIAKASRRRNQEEE